MLPARSFRSGTMMKVSEELEVQQRTSHFGKTKWRTPVIGCPRQSRPRLDQWNFGQIRREAVTLAKPPKTQRLAQPVSTQFSHGAPDVPFPGRRGRKIGIE